MNIKKFYRQHSQYQEEMGHKDKFTELAVKIILLEAYLYYQNSTSTFGELHTDLMSEVGAALMDYPDISFNELRREGRAALVRFGFDDPVTLEDEI